MYLNKSNLKGCGPAPGHLVLPILQMLIGSKPVHCRPVAGICTEKMQNGERQDARMPGCQACSWQSLNKVPSQKTPCEVDNGLKEKYGHFTLF